MRVRLWFQFQKGSEEVSLHLAVIRDGKLLKEGSTSMRLGARHWFIMKDNMLASRQSIPSSISYIVHMYNSPVEISHKKVAIYV